MSTRRLFGLVDALANGGRWGPSKLILKTSMSCEWSFLEACSIKEAAHGMDVSVGNAKVL
jgi:hypothetical protein